MSKNVYNGISFPGMLSVLFIGLKLTGYITWNWWWVLSPLWGPIALIMFIALCLFLMYIFITILELILTWYENWKDKRK